MHKSYFRGLMTGLLPKDVSIDQIDSEDGMFLMREEHDKVVNALTKDHHVGMTIVDEAGEIQFRTGPTQEKCGGVRFAPVEDVEIKAAEFCWISFED